MEFRIFCNLVFISLRFFPFIFFFSDTGIQEGLSKVRLEILTQKTRCLLSEREKDQILDRGTVV